MQLAGAGTCWTDVYGEIADLVKPFAKFQSRRQDSSRRYQSVLCSLDLHFARVTVLVATLEMPVAWSSEWARWSEVFGVVAYQMLVLE